MPDVQTVQICQRSLRRQKRLQCHQHTSGVKDSEKILYYYMCLKERRGNIVKEPMVRACVTHETILDTDDD